LVAAGLAGSRPAAAASFECHAAATAVERLICSDKNAGAADEAMARSYRRLLQKLSPSGADLIRASQRTFLASLAARCGLSSPSSEGRDWEGKTSAECLTNSMSERAGELQSALFKHGRWQLLRIETIEASLPSGGWPDDSDAPGETRPAVDTSLLLQIEPSRTTGESDWNSFMAKAVRSALAESRGDDTHDATPGPPAPQDNQAEARLVSASPDLIVADISQWWYSFGRPHGAGWTESTAWSFRLGRALQPGDVYLPGWEQAIGQLIWRQMLADGWRPEYGERQTASKDEVMRFTRQGICVEFSPYEVGGYAPPPPVAISWKALRPHLKARLPFEPRQLTDVREKIQC
jgi:uncharacterized protein YecT (DUF1311 family)